MAMTLESRLSELRQAGEDRKVGGYDRYMALVADTAGGGGTPRLRGTS
jgi:hypothetical protein